MSSWFPWYRPAVSIHDRHQSSLLLAMAAEVSGFPAEVSGGSFRHAASINMSQYGYHESALRPVLDIADDFLSEF